MRQEHQVRSLNHCISELQQYAYDQRLELQDAQHGYTESRREQVRPQQELSMKEKVLRDTQIRSMHEMGEMKRAQELRVDEVCAKNKRKSWDNTKAHLSVAGNARADEFNEWFGRNSRSGIKLQWETVLRFQSACNDSQVLVPRWTATNACLLTRGRHRDYRKTFLVINFLRLIHPEIIIKEFTLAHHKENEDQFNRLLGRGLFSQEMTNKVETQFQCRHLQEGRRLWVLQNRWKTCRIQWLDSKDSRFRNCSSTNSIIFGLEDTIQKSSDYLFWFSIGCNVTDQRSGDVWFIGGIEVFAISLWKEFSKFRDAGREDCFCSEQDRQEFPIQEEGQSGRTESPKGWPVSTRKDRLHDLRLLSWILLIYSLLLFMVTIFRNSIQDGTKFYSLCHRFHPMISWKVCRHSEYVSPRNSKLFWNCTTWRFIRRYRCPIIKNWRRRWRRVWIRNFDYETLTPGTGELKQVQWSRIEKEWVALKEEKVPVTSEKKKASVRKETSVVSGMRVTIVPKNWNTLPPHLPSHPSHEVEVCRRKEVSKAKVIMVPFSNRANIIWRVLARDRFVDIGIFPSVNGM